MTEAIPVDPVPGGGDGLDEGLYSRQLWVPYDQPGAEVIPTSKLQMAQQRTTWRPWCTI